MPFDNQTNHIADYIGIGTRLANRPAHQSVYALAGMLEKGKLRLRSNGSLGISQTFEYGVRDPRNMKLFCCSTEAYAKAHRRLAATKRAKEDHDHAIVAVDPYVLEMASPYVPPRFSVNAQYLDNAARDLRMIMDPGRVAFGLVWFKPEYEGATTIACNMLEERKIPIINLNITPYKEAISQILSIMKG